MKGPDVSETASGVVIAALVFLLCLATIGLFWEAQVIAKQQTVIRMMMEGCHE